MFASFFHQASRPIGEPRGRRPRVDDLGVPLTIRVSHRPERSLERLAELDERALPAGPHLVAEVAGRPIAAVGIRDGQAVADPFEHSAPIVEMLRVRAARIAV